MYLQAFMLFTSWSKNSSQNHRQKDRQPPTSHLDVQISLNFGRCGPLGIQKACMQYKSSTPEVYKKCAISIQVVNKKHISELMTNSRFLLLSVAKLEAFCGSVHPSGVNFRLGGIKGRLRRAGGLGGIQICLRIRCI